jgi:hypothetical protein
MGMNCFQLNQQKAERNAEIIARYQAGEPIKVIAADFEIAAQRVCAVVAQAGAPRRWTKTRNIAGSGPAFRTDHPRAR